MSCHFPSASTRGVSFTNVRRAACRSRVCIEFDALSPASHVAARTIAENSTRAFGSVLSKQNDRLRCSVISGIIAGIFCTAVLWSLAWLARLPRDAYVLENLSWTRDRTVVMQLSLAPGSVHAHRRLASFNQVAQSALAIWNPYLLHLNFPRWRIHLCRNTATTKRCRSSFRNNIYGETFDQRDSRHHAVDSRNGVLEETDTIFNTFYQWDSYRGNQRPGVQDFRRVAIHEFGHTLGLDHPDEHGQNVSAIMNSHASNLDTVQADDIAGVRSIYNTGPAYHALPNPPILRNLSTRALIGTGQNVAHRRLCDSGIGSGNVYRARDRLFAARGRNHSSHH